MRAALQRMPRTRSAAKAQGQTFPGARVYDVPLAKRSLEQTLLALGTDYIDFYLLHDPRSGDSVQFDDLIPFFEEQIALGRIGRWGFAVDRHANPYPELVIRGAVLQCRSDILARAEALSWTEEASFSFGSISSPLVLIRRQLNADPSAASRWRNELGIDPLLGDDLPRLLLAEALDAASHGVLLYGTTRRDRLSAAAGLLSDPPSKETLERFRSLAHTISPDSSAGAALSTVELPANKAP
jgi:hypothetical protein